MMPNGHNTTCVELRIFAIPLTQISFHLISCIFILLQCGCGHPHVGMSVPTYLDTILIISVAQTSKSGSVELLEQIHS